MNTYQRLLLSALGGLLCFSGIAKAQLQFTEIMANSVDSEPKWEWVEVYNAGSTAIDLNDYVLSTTTGTNALTAANINSANGNTMIPAGTAAVLYNGGTSALNFEESRFRNAWKIPSSVPLVGVSPAPSLSNSNTVGTISRSLALWPTLADYNTDFGALGADNVAGTLDDYTTATAAIEYTQYTDPADPSMGGRGFPATSSAGLSLAWNGTGSYTDGTNWAHTDTANVGMNGIVTSVLTNLPTQTVNVNSVNDVANPGTGSAAAIALPDLSITEVMYNPRSPDADWEFVEVRNNTGSAIDFSATPHILHDGDGTALSATNVTSGSIPDQSFAVFFDAALNMNEFQNAWDAGGSKGINFIPVANWPAFGNGGDDIGIWSSQTDYNNDISAGGGDSTLWTATQAKLEYDDDNVVFPQDDGNASIHYTGNTTSFSSGWELSDTTDGISTNPAQISIVSAPQDHTGGDTGSPGTFGTTTSLACDLDGNGQCDLDDIEMLVDNILAGSATTGDIATWLTAASSPSNPYLGGAKTFVIGDANLDGSVDSADLGQLLNSFGSTSAIDWANGNMSVDGVIDSADLGQLLNQFGFSSAAAQAVPEPASFALLFLAAIGFAASSRRRNR